MLMSMSAMAQTTISGRITSGEDSSPIPGVNVILKGTSIGTISDADGRYSVNVSGTSPILVFSFVGYTTQEVTIEGRTSVDVVLPTDANQLSEVVVTALGIEKDKSKVGYSVQEVKGSDLIRAREPNPINNLAGKIAGLTIAASPELLGRPNIYLRGKSPLFVVDGVPIQSDTWNISADDIETYTVLKGPAASALYGSRGQYGAIQITTKRGTKDPRGFSIDFNSSTTIENGFTVIPKVQDEYGPGDHGRYAFGDGRGAGLYDSDYDIWGPKFEGQLIPQYDGVVTPGTEYTTVMANGSEYTGNIVPTPWTARGKDNLQKFIQTGVLTTNNIAVSASGEKYDLRFSTSYAYQKGLVPNSQLNSNNFNLSAGFDFSPKIRFETNINYNKQYTDNFPDVNYGPNSLIYNVTLWGGADWSMDDMKNYWQKGKEGIQQIYADYTRYNNPWFSAYEWTRGHYKTDIYGYMSLKWEITPMLQVVGRTQINTYDLLRTEKFPYSGTTYGREQAKGDYREDQRNLFENNTDLLLNFSKDVSEDFSIKASLGGNMRTFVYRSSYTTTDYLNVPGWYSFSNSQNPIKSFNFEAPMQVLSAYGYIDASYRNFLNLSVTGRVDKHSTLPLKNNKYFYPSVSMSMVLSELMQMPQPFSFLKIRGSYANVGSALTSADIGPTPSVHITGNPLGYGSTYLSPYDGPSYINAPVYNTSLLYNSQPAAFYSALITNPDLKPEFSSAWEAGFDVRFLSDRLKMDATYFESIDGKRIVVDPLSQSTGYTGALVNAIKTQRKGLEISLDGSILNNRQGLSWDILANWSTYKETIKEAYPGNSNLDLYRSEGERIDQFYGTALTRTPDGQLIINASDGRTIPVTSFGNGNARRFLGYLNPDWVWGINNRFGYKNWTFSFQFDGSIGGVIANYVQQQTFRGGRHVATIEGTMGVARYGDYKGVKTLVGEGLNVTSGTPKINDEGVITNMEELTFAPNTTATYLQDWISRYYNTNEGNLMSRTFTKLREVVIGYNIPSSVLSRTAIRRASISLVGRNLLYWAEHKDIDIDQYRGGETGSGLQTPSLRRYGFNLNVTF
jgi:TonB-linked SusC/RagA family outer membrane protein